MAREVYCHAANLFFEARGEIPLGQRWVLDVVKNRVISKKYPDTHCEVIKQYKQFSWYEERKYQIPEDPIYWEEYILSEYRGNDLELSAWRRSFLLAFNHFLHSKIDHTDGSLFYMTVERFIERNSMPFNRTQAVAIVGNHIFFNYCKRKTKCYQF